ncbi:MAG: thiamine phosphate synthase [Deltaproteobacteria bacterium]|nr:thiamine phosphate synthase [Deltaproteobacteria bacterium]
MKGLYLVTDRFLCESAGNTVEDVILQAVQGGASYVQLREKSLSTRAFIEEARIVKEILKPYGVPLIINDRVDVALAVGAEGVHVGQSDMPYNLARGLMGPEALIGVSVETWDDVQQAEACDCDYIGVSPLFKTPTKTDTKGDWGLEGLKRIRAFSRRRLVAIGGINKGNAADIVAAGADCIAVVSALCCAVDPCMAAEELTEIVRTGLEKRTAARPENARWRRENGKKPS